MIKSSSHPVKKINKIKSSQRLRPVVKDEEESNIKKYTKHKQEVKSKLRC